MPTATLEKIDPNIREFVTSKRRLLIDGKWVDAQSGRTFPVYNPATGEVLDEFAQIESLDNGKPLAVARVADVPLAVDLFRYMAGWATKIEGQTLSTSQLGSDYFAYTLREPIGVVGQIIPWNFPLLMAA